MRKYKLSINDKPFDIKVKSISTDQATVEVNGKTIVVDIFDIKSTVELSGLAAPVYGKAPAKTAAPVPTPVPVAAPAPRAAAPAPRTAAPAPVAAPAPRAAAPAPKAAAKAAGPGTSVPAPIPGAVLDILVGVGDAVAAGDVICKMEAMKMENDIAAPCGGTVQSISANVGDSLAQGQEIMVIG